MWSKARKETRQMCLGSSDMVVAAACMGWQEKRKTWVCRRRLDQGINHRAVSVLCSSGCGNNWRGILSIEIDPLTDNSWPQSSLLFPFPFPDTSKCPHPHHLPCDVSLSAQN